MVYRLTCPACGRVSEYVFVRLGAVARCDGCSRTWRIEARHVKRRSTTGQPIDEVDDAWAVPTGHGGSGSIAGRGTAGSGMMPGSGSVSGLGPGSGIAIGEALDQAGSAEAIIGMSTLTEVLSESGPARPGGLRGAPSASQSGAEGARTPDQVTELDASGEVRAARERSRSKGRGLFSRLRFWCVAFAPVMGGGLIGIAVAGNPGSDVITGSDRAPDDALNRNSDDLASRAGSDTAR